jgi:hypothetical protein
MKPKAERVDNTSPMARDALSRAFAQAVEADDFERIVDCFPAHAWSEPSDALAEAASRWKDQQGFDQLLSLSRATKNKRVIQEIACWVMELAMSVDDEPAALAALKHAKPRHLKALIEHAINGCMDRLCQALWERGAPTLDSGMNESMCAAVFGWDPSWRDWARRCDPLTVDERGWTALHFAAYHANPVATRALIPLGGLDAVNDTGLTPLAEAARGGDLECLRMLADASPFEPDSAAWARALQEALIRKQRLAQDDLFQELRAREISFFEKKELEKHAQPAPGGPRRAGL